MRVVTGLLVAWGLGLTSAAAADEKPPEPGPMVTVEVAIAEFSGEAAEPGEGESAEALVSRIRELEKEGKVDSVTRVRLAALEEQTATVQQGETPWVATGRASFGRGGNSQSVFSRESIGLVVSATTRIADEGWILVEVSVERSRLGPQREVKGEEPPRGTETLTLRSTVRVPDGGTVVAQSSEVRAGDAKTRQVVLVSARVDDRDRKAGQADPEPNVFRRFVLKQVAAASAGSLLENVYGDCKELRIEIDPHSQSVLVKGPRELLDEIGKLLQQIDRQPLEKAMPAKES